MHIVPCSLRKKQEVECEYSDIAAQLHMEDKLKRSLQGVQTTANIAKKAVSETEEQIADVSILPYIHVYVHVLYD
jgi:uncharacterized protein YhbP (UPF0306 family)